MLFDLATFTLVHVVLSLVGIGSGFVVVYGLFAAKRLDTWTAIFLASNVATSATGFLFPFERFLPSHAVGTDCHATLRPRRRHYGPPNPMAPPRPRTPRPLSHQQLTRNNGDA